MGWANKLIGWASGNGAEVDADGNQYVTGQQVFQRLGGVTPKPHSVGAQRMFFENDPGGVTGNPYLESPLVTSERQLSVAVNTPIFIDNFTETAQNTSIWRTQFTTMTMSVAGGFLLLNANSTATTASGVQYTTWQPIPLFGNSSLHLEITSALTAIPQAGQVFCAGTFPHGASATVLPTEGIYFKLDNAGLIGVMNYNGVETSTAVLITAANMKLNQNIQFSISLNQREVEYWIDNVLYAELVVPAGNGIPYMFSSLPISFLQFNSGAVVGPQMQIKIASCHAEHEAAYGKTNGEIMAGTGGMGSQGQDGGTMGSTALLTNSATAAAAALSNTNAAAQFTGLGGVFWVLPTLTAGTDGILCSYLNPVGSINQTPKRLVIRGVKISGGVTTVLAGGPCVFACSLAYGHTSISMATTETASFATATTKAPRRIPFSMQNYVVNAAAGVGDSPGFMQFLAPIYVNPGEYVAVVMRNMGVVTTTGAIAFTVGFDANWE